MAHNHRDGSKTRRGEKKAPFRLSDSSMRCVRSPEKAPRQRKKSMVKKQ